MLKLTRYVAMTVISSTLIVILVLAGVYIIFTFVAESNSIGQGSYDVWSALSYILLTIPANLYLALPVAGLLGCLLGLGMLASRSELIAMRASGASIKQISHGVVIAALGFMLISFVMGSFLGPWLQHTANMRRALAKQGQAVLVTSRATWLKDKNDFIYIGKSLPGGRLENVVRYNIKDHRLVSVTQAKRADLADRRWLLSDVSVTKFLPKKITSTQLSSMSWDNLVAPALLQVIASNPQNLTLWGLHSFIRYREKNNLSVRGFQLNFWQALLRPFSVLVMMLMAIPFVFGPLRSSSTGFRLLFGVVFGFSFYIVDQFFGPFSIYNNFSPFWGAALPIVLYGGVLSLLLWRTK